MACHKLRWLPWMRATLSRSPCALCSEKEDRNKRLKAKHTKWGTGKQVVMREPWEKGRLRIAIRTFGSAEGVYRLRWSGQAHSPSLRCLAWSWLQETRTIKKFRTGAQKHWLVRGCAHTRVMLRAAKLQAGEQRQFGEGEGGMRQIWVRKQGKENRSARGFLPGFLGGFLVLFCHSTYHLYFLIV